MKTLVKTCNFCVSPQNLIFIQSFNGPSDLLSLDPVDQVDTTQFDGTWTAPYWPTLKAKYDLVMPGEPTSSGANGPAS